MRQVQLEIHTIRTWDLDDETNEALYKLGYTNPSDEQLIDFFIDLWKEHLSTDDLVLDHIHGVVIDV